MKYRVIEELKIRAEPSRNDDTDILGILYPGFIIDARDAEDHDQWLIDENGFYYWKESVDTEIKEDGDSNDPASETEPPRIYNYNRLLQDIPQADKEAGGNGVLVAVFDTGCMDHPDFRDNIVCFYDAVEETESTSFMDDTGHGTFVTGLICSSGNESKIVGLAPGVKIIVVKCSKNGRFFPGYFYKGLKWLVEDSDYSPDIINMSFSCASSNYKEKILALFEKCHQQSTLLVSAGQDDEKLFKRTRPLYPAYEKYVIAVGAIQNKIEIESSLIPGIDYVIPKSNEYESITRPGSSFQKKGCSFAAAMVTGAFARMKSSLDQELSVEEIRERLESNLQTYSKQAPQQQIKIYKNEATHSPA